MQPLVHQCARGRESRLILSNNAGYNMHGASCCRVIRECRNSSSNFYTFDRSVTVLTMAYAALVDEEYEFGHCNSIGE